MKSRKGIIALIIALAAMLLLSGCGAKSAEFNESEGLSVQTSYYGWEDDNVLAEEWVEAPMAPEAPEEDWDEVPVPTPAEPEAAVDEELYAEGAASANEPQEKARKIIKTGSMTVETLDYDRFIAEFEQSVVEYGGYIETSDQSGRSTYGSSTRYASYTVRVPAEKYDSFIGRVGELGTVTRSNHSVEDVTMTYIDVEARLESLTAERDSFMALMEKAQTVEEILNIQSYLTDVNYQIESYTAQLNTLKNLVSYSTVTVGIEEVERITPQEPKSVGERISSNLSENLYNIKTGFINLFVLLVSSLPYIGILAAVAIVIVVIVLLATRASKRRQEKYFREMSEKNGENGSQNGSDSAEK